MSDFLVAARPHFFMKVPTREWRDAPLTDGVDAKFVSHDGHHELVIGTLMAPNDPAKASERLEHVLASFLESNRAQGSSDVVSRWLTDELGPENDAGFVLDFGGTVIRRKIFSVLAAPGLIGEPGRFQILVNLALYTQHPGREDGARRFEAALQSLHVAPGAYSNVVGTVPAPLDPRALLPALVSRAKMNVYSSVLSARNIDDPTRGMWPIGHDVFSMAVYPVDGMPRMRSMVFESDAVKQSLPYGSLIEHGFGNIATRFDELAGRRMQTKGGQTVLVFHGNALNAAFALHPMIQQSFAEQLRTRKVLACFPRNDLVALFADGTSAQREEARAFILEGAGTVDLSDRLFELTGVGGAREAAPV